MKNRIISVNTHVLTGRLMADATYSDNGNARFSIIHNQGKEQPALIKDLVMYAERNKKAVEIPKELLTKGTAVKVEYFERAVVRKSKKTGEDKTFVNCVAWKVGPAEVQQISDNEADGEETPAPEAPEAQAPAEPEEA